MNQSNVDPNYVNMKCSRLNHFAMFTLLNSTKNLNHSANRVYQNYESKIFAIRCNCGPKVYHPVLGDNVIWGKIISSKDLQLLKELTFDEIAYRLKD
jgi:hypothetical protein